MDVFLDFIFKYWKYILVACMALIEIILLIISICKKKVVLKTDLFADLYVQIPAFINEAETTGLVGKDKLSHVVRKCLDFLSANTGLSVQDLYFTYVFQIVKLIEDILSTPQKKEVSNEEKEIK